MAGGAHVDVNTSINGAYSIARDLGQQSFGAGCELPLNTLPLGFVQSAMLQILNDWIDGTMPPDSALLELADLDTLSLDYDAEGNALGGVRIPQLAMPMGRYLGTNQGEGFCFLFGGFSPISRDLFARRYGSEADYLRRFRPLVELTVRSRFLLEADTDRFLEHVRSTIQSLE